MASQDDRVRERAYELWEKSGRPSGRDDDFWHQAMAEIGATTHPDEDIAPPKPSKSAKAAAPKATAKAAPPAKPAASKSAAPKSASSKLAAAKPVAARSAGRGKSNGLAAE